MFALNCVPETFPLTKNTERVQARSHSSATVAFVLEWSIQLGHFEEFFNYFLKYTKN